MPPWLNERIDALLSQLTEAWPLLLDGWPMLLPSLLALLFLCLWLRARARPSDPELREELRQARNQLKLLKGDTIQAKRLHAAEVAKLTKDLERLRR